MTLVHSYKDKTFDELNDILSSNIEAFAALTQTNRADYTLDQLHDHAQQLELVGIATIRAFQNLLTKAVAPLRQATS